MSILLQNKLDRVNNAINDLKTNLHFSQDTAIEKVARAAKTMTQINVYTQLEEPSEKCGVWLQTETPYDTINFCPADKSWLINLHRKASIPYNHDTGTGVCVGDYAYIFGGDGGTTTAYKYDLRNDTFTKLPNIPWQHSYTWSEVVGTDIYVGGSWSTYAFGKFDTLTERWTQLAQCPQRQDEGMAVAVGDYIYTFNGYRSRTVCKYDIKNNKWTKLSVQTPECYVFGDVFAIGTDIYLLSQPAFSSNKYNKAQADYKFDTLTDSFVTLPMSPTRPDTLITRACIVDNEERVFLFGSSAPSNTGALAFLYNPRTDEYTQLDDTVRGMGGTSRGIMKYGNEIIFFCFRLIDSMTYVEPTTDGEGNIVKIMRSGNSKQFKPFMAPDNWIGFDIYNNCYFDDISFFSQELGATIDVPIYYGDGEKWILLKGGDN